MILNKTIVKTVLKYMEKKGEERNLHFILKYTEVIPGNTVYLYQLIY